MVSIEVGKTYICNDRNVTWTAVGKYLDDNFYGNLVGRLCGFIAVWAVKPDGTAYGCSRNHKWSLCNPLEVFDPMSIQGLYQKFVVKRVDDTDRLGEKHHGCQYFVLDVTHDHFAKPALLAYAEACKASNPKLAEDLRGLVEQG